MTGVSSVHPHTHGEHAGVTAALDAAYGSSPHAWGTHVVCHFNPLVRRFIPTRMGNTSSTLIFMFFTAVHPHTHGEHVCHFNPPLVRQVHPHTHGEHSSSFSGRGSHFGSSPHAWGTLEIPEPECVRRRFIPTRMGNTGLSDIFPVFRPVHPHTHGEHGAGEESRALPNGSSPHAWGTHCAGGGRYRGCRFIPTRMGNTLATLAAEKVVTVHPHTHGEHAVNS